RFPKSLQPGYPGIEMGTLGADRLQARVLRDVWPRRWFQALVLRYQPDDPLGGRCRLTLVDMLDGEERRRDFLQFLDRPIALLKLDSKRLRLGEERGLELVKLKMWNKPRILDVLPERSLQGRDVSDWILRVATVGLFPWEVLREAIKVDHGG